MMVFFCIIFAVICLILLFFEICGFRTVSDVPAAAGKSQAEMHKICAYLHKSSDKSVNFAKSLHKQENTLYILTKIVKKP